MIIPQKTRTLKTETPDTKTWIYHTCCFHTVLIALIVVLKIYFTFVLSHLRLSFIYTVVCEGILLGSGTGDSNQGTVYSERNECLHN